MSLSHRQCDSEEYPGVEAALRNTNRERNLEGKICKGIVNSFDRNYCGRDTVESEEDIKQSRMEIDGSSIRCGFKIILCYTSGNAEPFKQRPVQGCPC